MGPCVCVCVCVYLCVCVCVCVCKRKATPYDFNSYQGGNGTYESVLSAGTPPTQCLHIHIHPHTHTYMHTTGNGHRICPPPVVCLCVCCPSYCVCSCRSPTFHLPHTHRQAIDWNARAIAFYKEKCFAGERLEEGGYALPPFLPIACSIDLPPPIFLHHHLVDRSIR
jgi:hypothetical protein